MAMGYYTGRTGHLDLDNVQVAKLKDVSLDASVELLSTNSIDSVVNTFTPGVKGATGSGTLIYYRLETAEEKSKKAQFTELIKRIIKKGAITDTDRVKLTINVGGGNNDDVSFYAFITQARLGVSTGELSVVPFQFTMDGDFIEVVS